MILTLTSCPHCDTYTDGTEFCSDDCERAYARDVRFYALYCARSKMDDQDACPALMFDTLVPQWAELWAELWPAQDDEDADYVENAVSELWDRWYADYLAGYQPPDPQPLGRVVGQILAMRTSHDDPMYPGEGHCAMPYGKVRALIASTGLTPAEFLDEVEARTSSRWVYMSQLAELVSVMRCTCGMRSMVMSTHATRGPDSSFVYKLECGHEVM